MKQLGMALVILAVALTARAQFTFVTNNGAITITGYTGAGGDLVIPSEINGYPVTAIASSAFLSCNLTGVTIPDTVTTIGGGAFELSAFLTSVTIGNGVTNIADGAFSDCFAIASVTIGNSVTSVGEAAFENCYSLKSVAIPKGVTGIGDFAFSGSGLTNVVIPNSVTNIVQYAFYWFILSGTTSPATSLPTVS